MIEDLFHYKVLHVVFNAFLAFLTTTLLVEGMIRGFRIRKPRLKSLFRLLPLLKLPLDVWIADWSRWAIVHGINPLDCAEGTRMFYIGCNLIDVLSNAVLLPVALRIGFETTGGYTFSIVDLLSPLVNQDLLRAVSCSFIALTSFQCILLLAKCAKNRLRKKEFLSRCIPCRRPVDNLLLGRTLSKLRISLHAHPEYEGSPVLIGVLRPRIIFPEALLCRLEQKEFEAIIAHEAQHAKSKDILVRGAVTFIRKVFWWVPTGKLINSIELEQEYACDQHCSAYQIDPVDLASGIVKVAKFANSQTLPLGAHLFRRKLLKKRIEQLLDYKVTASRWKDKLFISCGAVVMLCILFGRFWIL